MGEKRVGRGSPIVALREVEKNFATFRYILQQKWHKEAEIAMVRGGNRE